jgi:UDP-glucose:(heptosyl)LPS alpha-1,3-glucosyltransferase
MRVALLTRRFDPAGGGTERDLMITIGCLRQGGHEVAVYADEVRAAVPDLRVHRVGRMKLPRTLAFLRFAFAGAPRARRDGCDLVLSFARVTNADVLRSGGSAHISYLRAAKRWLGTARAGAMRMAPYHRAQLMVERRGFTNPQFRAAIAVSEFVRRDLIAQFDLPPGRVSTIYNGVDLEKFKPALEGSARSQIRNRFRIPPDAPLVLFVGNGFARKGLGFLIDALPRIAAKPYLLVVGSDRARGSFRRRADRCRAGDRVIFAGNQPSVEQFFNAADAFALPSLFEPFGNVAMEAMACGLPALVSSQCGVAELMPPLLRPLVVEDSADAGEIAGKLETMLTKQAELGRVAGDAAAQYTWERHSRELNRFVDALRDRAGCASSD